MTQADNTFFGERMMKADFSINGSEVRCIYRSSLWTRKNPSRVFVTRDNRIWLGYGESPERFSHVGNVGDRGTQGFNRDDILRAANA